MACPKPGPVPCAVKEKVAAKQARQSNWYPSSNQPQEMVDLTESAATQPGPMPLPGQQQQASVSGSAEASTSNRLQANPSKRKRKPKIPQEDDGVDELDPSQHHSQEVIEQPLPKKPKVSSDWASLEIQEGGKRGGSRADWGSAGCGIRRCRGPRSRHARIEKEKRA